MLFGMKPVLNPCAYGCNGPVVVSVTLAGDQILNGSGQTQEDAVQDLRININRTNVLTCNGCGVSMTREAVIEARDEVVCNCAVLDMGDD